MTGYATHVHQGAGHLILSPVTYAQLAEAYRVRQVDLEGLIRARFPVRRVPARRVRVRVALGRVPEC
jgi:hypothetical protein